VKTLHGLVSEIEAARQRLCTHPITQVHGEPYSRVPDTMIDELHNLDGLLKALAVQVLPPSKDYDPKRVVAILDGMLKERS
jgi:hypothetical protein